MDELELLEQNGILRALVAIVEKPRYVTELRKSGVNPEGIMSLDSLDKCRANLSKLGLITERIDEGPRPRTWLTITEKGRRVAQKVREIQRILED